MSHKDPNAVIAPTYEVSTKRDYIQIVPAKTHLDAKNKKHTTLFDKRLWQVF
jgi:hypothetical protein